MENSNHRSLNHRFYFVSCRFSVVKAPLKQTFHHYMHFLSTLVAIGVAIAGTVIAFQHFIEGPWGPLHRAHALLGLGALLLMVLGVVNGAMCRPEDLGTSARRMWMRSHVILGVGLVVCATCAAVLGIQKFHDLSGRSSIVRPYESFVETTNTYKCSNVLQGNFMKIMSIITRV